MSDTLKMVKYRIQYVFDTDICLICSDIHIGKVSVKSLFLNKKIISDTIQSVFPGECQTNMLLHG